MAERRRPCRPRADAVVVAGSVLVATVLGAAVAAAGAVAQLPPSERDPDEVRRRADEILADRAFAPERRSFLRRVLGRILEWLGDLFPGGGAAGSGGSSFLSIVLVAVAVVLLVLVLRSVLGSRGRSGRRTREDEDDGLEIEVEEHVAVATWEARAAEHESAGRWREALRCRYRALVGRLAERGAVPAVPGRTAGELRDDLRQRAPAAAEPFDDAARLFEEAWYGGRPTGPEENRRFRDDAERVLAGTGGERS